MINPNWSRWIVSSLAKHFSTKAEDVAYLYIEGRARPNPEPLPRFELRIDGPYYDELTRGYFHIDIEINLLITSQKSATDAYSQERLEGIAASAFENAINVIRYGNGDDDDNTRLGCLLLKTGQNKERLITSRFGLVDPTREILQSTVEGHYRMTLKV